MRVLQGQKCSAEWRRKEFRGSGDDWLCRATFQVPCALCLVPCLGDSPARVLGRRAESFQVGVVAACCTCELFSLFSPAAARTDTSSCVDSRCYL
jgi:hypothetical protein